MLKVEYRVSERQVAEYYLDLSNQMPWVILNLGGQRLILPINVYLTLSPLSPH